MQMVLFILKYYLASVGHTSYNQAAKCLNTYLHTTMPNLYHTEFN